MKESSLEKGWEAVCAGLGPKDGISSAILTHRALDRSENHRNINHRNINHCSQQYCKQIQLAIVGGPSCDCDDPTLRELIVTAVEPILGCAAVFATLVTQEQDLNQIEGIQQSPTESAGILSVSGHHQ